MTKILNIGTLQDFPHFLDEFKAHILLGLSSEKKWISSKYFYDEHGSELFNQITRHPDYYLTNCELSILENHKNDIADIIGNHPFNLIELGPGDGIKTEMLIDCFLQKKMQFTYIPIDISTHFLQKISEKLKKHQPNISLLPIHSDYFHGLKRMSHDSKRRNLVLFLGSSIGNYTMDDAQVFLQKTRGNLNKHDYMCIGFDLKKNPEILLRAYDDSHGITRAFNLNLLTRLNRELNATFDLEKFMHFPIYNAECGAMESYLVSQTPQTVLIQALKKTFTFEQDERIHVETSNKYLLRQIEDFAQLSGFRIIAHYFDAQHYFVDSIWQAID